MRKSQIPHIALVTGTRMTLLSLTEQLAELTGGKVRMTGYALDEETPDQRSISADLILVSTPHLFPQAEPYLDPAAPRIIARRVPNYHHVDKLLQLPEGTNVLFVNDFKETVLESIDALIKLGVDHLQYIPYAPGMELPANGIRVAITPGETDLVPASVGEIINIGPRLLDLMTVLELFSLLSFPDEDKVHISERYMQRIIALGKDMAAATRLATRLHRQLKQVLDGVNEGILAVDGQGMITVFNENLRHLARMPVQQAIRKPLRQVIHVPELASFLEAKDGEATKHFQIEGTDLLVTRIPQDDGFIATFRSAQDIAKADAKRRRELRSRGHLAKYGFDDIRGASPALQAVCRTAAKLARTDLPVLIEGESGTGKELFASAIHNASSRADGPFLAVNFSALSEDLVESELFGYEEGAFTGAKKGGRPGLFEQAAGGTIFLDEIGDISLKIQARLLRVLQEKEVMRIGAGKIISVDFRVVAATNKNLLQMIEEGLFREDLYHRLKVLYLKLPPLRERKEDIPLLAKHFLANSSIRPLTILSQVFDKLYKYPWYGNVRELKNTIDYMCAVCDGDEVGLHDIPDESFFQRAPAHKAAPAPHPDAASEAEEIWRELDSLGERGLYLALLQAIRERRAGGESTGRRSLSLHLQTLGYHLSEQQIRKKMDNLEKSGLLTKLIGRSGSTLSAKALLLLEAAQR